MNTEDAIQAAVDRIVSGYNLALKKAVSSARAEAHRAGMLAGLKEAERVVFCLKPHLEERPSRNVMVTYTVAVLPDANAAILAIRARIAEIEAEAKTP